MACTSALPILSSLKLVTVLHITLKTLQVIDENRLQFLGIKVKIKYKQQIKRRLKVQP